MSELRQDPTTNDWIIVAKERAQRPVQFARAENRAPLPEHDPSCPFCPGNEARTPPEAWAYRTGRANDQGWWVRTISNKFPALRPEGSLERRMENGLFRTMQGVGHHEVVIETPSHNTPIPFMPDGQVEEVVLMYRDRYLALRDDPRVKYLILFKNSGERAGTSLLHPHSQLVATPIVPPHIRRKHEVATQYYDNTGKCVYCEVRDEELRAGIRVVMETERFVVLHPFASRYPFETWILPKAHHPSFGHIAIPEAKEFARVLKTTLRKLWKALDGPDYNYILHTVPLKDENEEYYLWHAQVIPRIAHMAGFEMGSGIYINTVLPEETAEAMRRVGEE